MWRPRVVAYLGWTGDPVANSRGHPDPRIRTARAKLGVAIREIDEAKAIAALRELLTARRAVRMESDLRALVAASGQDEDKIPS
jgi:hypothetical protein